MARHGSDAISALFLVLILAASACEGGPGTPVVSRDSAGIAITLSNVPGWGPDQGWEIAAEPALVVGGLVGQRPFEFTTVGDARILDDGRLLVTHCSNPPELRLYGTDGRFLGTLGGPGTGPGRCNFILHSWLAADSVILYDPSLARITYFRLGAGVARIIDLDGAGLGDVEGGDPVWHSRFADGRLLGRPNHPVAQENGRTRAPFHWVRLDPDGMTVDTLVAARGTEYVVEGLGTPEEDARPVLFSPSTHAHAHGSRLFLADSERFWIEEHDTTGDPVRRFGRDWDPYAIDRGFRQDYREQRVAAAPSTDRAGVRREMARAVFADHLPAHEGQMIVDPGDNLWIAHVPTPEDQDRPWSVFDPSGRWLGEVHVPAPLQLTDIGQDYVVGVWRAANGVQSIRRFPLLKPGT